MTQRVDGDRKAMMLESQSCAPVVTAGHQYDLGVWYTTTTPEHRRSPRSGTTSTAGWQYWTDLTNLPVTSSLHAGDRAHPGGPAEHRPDHLGRHLYGTGTLTTDDYTMVDVDRARPRPHLHAPARPAPRARGR